MTCEGNTLAYALKSFENLMELDHGWENFSEEFVHMVIKKIKFKIIKIILFLKILY